MNKNKKPSKVQKILETIKWLSIFVKIKNQLFSIILAQMAQF